jgi:hypothetical protein
MQERLKVAGDQGLTSDLTLFGFAAGCLFLVLLPSSLVCA